MKEGRSWIMGHKDVPARRANEVGEREKAMMTRFAIVVAADMKSVRHRWLNVPQADTIYTQPWFGGR